MSELEQGYFVLPDEERAVVFSYNLSEVTRALGSPVPTGIIEPGILPLGAFTRRLMTKRNFKVIRHWSAYMGHTKVKVVVGSAEGVDRGEVLLMLAEVLLEAIYKG